LYRWSWTWWLWWMCCILSFDTYNSENIWANIWSMSLSHLRAECMSRLTPIAIFKIDIDETSIVRFVSHDKCLRSILLTRVELKYIFSLSLLAFHFFFFVCMREFNCPIRVNAPFCYYCCCLINTVGIRIAMSDKEMRSSWMQGSYPQYTKRNVLILDIVTPYYNCVHSIYVHTCIWKHVNDISSKSSK